MRRQILKLLALAGTLAISKKDGRGFCVSALGIRSDGTIVSAVNGHPWNIPCKAAHAEARLIRKLDRGAEVYVARVLKNGELAMSRPCKSCLVKMIKAKVSRVYYSIGENEYECIKV